TASPAFFSNVLEISSADRDRTALPKTFGQWSQTRRGLCGIGKPPSVPIFFFCEAAALDQLSVIQRIMRSQNRGSKLKSVDQQAADVVSRIIDRTHDFGATFLAQPTSRSLKKRGRHVRIVD